MLRLAESASGYAAEQIGNGLSPEQARLAAADVAAELTAVAATLRRLTALIRLSPAERRALAVELAATGLDARRIAEQLAVSPSTARRYLAARR